VSRSGDEGVVALVDQWFIPYGEEEWRATCDKALENMRCYGNRNETRNEFVAALNWLSSWPCSRTYGLGTKFPWAPEFLVCSLSDSTLYMAYYTVAHLLHEGSLDGSTVGALCVCVCVCVCACVHSSSLLVSLVLRNVCISCACVVCAEVCAYSVC
jgi:leucyl-tRNA synthetase